MAALTKGLRGDEMAEIGLLKAAGRNSPFTHGAKSVTNAQVMRRALTYARDFDALSSITPKIPTSSAKA
jgi:dihydroorotase